MPVRKLTTLAAALALLTVTAPAHAATIQWDLSGVTNTPFSNSIATVTGFFDYNTTTQTFPTYGFSVTSSPLVTGGLGDFTLTPSTSYVSNISGPNNLQIQNNGYSDANAEILTSAMWLSTEQQAQFCFSLTRVLCTSSTSTPFFQREVTPPFKAN